jgi:hypothetical protein
LLKGQIVGWIDELFKINKADAVAIALSPLVSTRGSRRSLLPLSLVSLSRYPCRQGGTVSY